MAIIGVGATTGYASLLAGAAAEIKDGKRVDGHAKDLRTQRYFSRATRTLAGPTRIVAMSVPLSPVEREALAHSAAALKDYAATSSDAAAVG